MTEKIITLISKEAIEKKVEELGRAISMDYAGKNLTLVCVLKGAFIFAADLSRKITVPLEMEFVDVSSYKKGIKPSSDIEMVLDTQEPLEGKDVLLVEDIADTGRSIYFIKKRILEKNPASFRLCALLDKPDARIMPDISPDYYGFIIPNKFVVGYGLDYAQKHRNLPYIGYMSFEE